MAPSVRRKCLAVLCKVCSHHALVPRSMQIPLCYDRTKAPRYQGGFAEVWKSRHEGIEVAVKVLKVFVTSDLAKLTKVGFPICQRPRVDRLAATTEILQGGYHLESSPPPECVATVWSDDERQPVCNGVGMDG